LAETEQRIRREERELEKLVERERRLVKQFRQKGGNRLQLDKAAADREKVETDLEDLRAEAEVVKMMYLREGLIVSLFHSNLIDFKQLIFSGDCGCATQFGPCHGANFRLSTRTGRICASSSHERCSPNALRGSPLDQAES
jgi:hypothetical protein